MLVLVGSAKRVTKRHDQACIQFVGAGLMVGSGGQAVAEEYEGVADGFDSKETLAGKGAR
jgi:hypothetical protein